ncbi:dihydrofolate reductase [Hyaloraphidium curvatum]|nr:dihydrofolate reductase [Hyaloraphidium curvatum]
MKIAIIAALARNRAIGRGNALPWRLPDDLKRFKALTTGRACVQGRKTFESIGRPLPNRLNIIVSRDPAFAAPGCEVARSLPDALRAARAAGGIEKDAVFICGGGVLYEEAVPLADVMYLTRVEADVEGDAFFPEFDEGEWTVVEEERHLKDAKHDHDFTFVTYVRKRADGSA